MTARLPACLGRFQSVVATACRDGFLSVRERGGALIVLWIAATAVVVSYYAVSGVPALLGPVARWQRAKGFLASFVLCALFCGIVPYGVYLCRRESGRRSPLVMAVAQALWCGICGVVCSWFFSVQSRWFGCGHDFATVLFKVLVDQFGWSVLVIVPATATFYAVLSGGWHLKDEPVSFRVFLTRVYLPSLIMNWFVGIPSNCAVYAFPSDLQVPVLGLMSSAWAVICTGLGARSGSAIRRTCRMTSAASV